MNVVQILIKVAMIFFMKSLKICSRFNLLFRRFSFDFFQVQFISFVERKANYTIEEQKCKFYKKRGPNFSFESGI